jgi:histidinol phosphatase-like enzyme
MLLQAARDLGLRLEGSWLVGDRWVDIAAAEAAGVAGVLIDREYSWRPSSDGAPPGGLRATATVNSISEAADAIVQGSRARAFGSGQSV